MLIHLVSHLLTQYETNLLIASLLNSTLTHILFSMNPDGYILALKRSRGHCYGEVGRYEQLLRSLCVTVNRVCLDYFTKSLHLLAFVTVSISVLYKPLLCVQISFMCFFSFSVYVLRFYINLRSTRN